MGLIRPPGRDVTRRNLPEVVYLKGDENTDGSIRFVIDEDTDIPTIEIRVTGLWQPSSFQISPDSLHIGLGLALSKAGHHLLASDTAGHFHFYAHNFFDGETSISEAKILHAYEFQEREVIQSNSSGEITSTSFGFTLSAEFRELIPKAYLQTGTNVSSEPVRIRVYEGINDTGTLIFDQTYPASNFPADSEIELTTEGFVELYKAVTYYFKITSDDNLSIKANVAETFPWLAVDRSLVREDDMLQTIEWVDGNTFVEGQLSIQNRQIYQCNEDGVQETSFASNPEKWNVVSPSIYSWEVIENNTAIIIPEKHQMAVHGTLTIDGDLLLKGTLALRN